MSAALSNTEPGWLGDPTINWNIVLALTITVDPPADLQDRLDALNDELGSPRWQVVRGPDPEQVQRAVIDPEQATVQVGLAARHPTPENPAHWHLVLAGHHSRLDGMGLLAALARLLDVDPRAAARGLPDRARTSQGGLVSRLREVLLRPGDVLPRVGGQPRATADRVGVDQVSGSVSTTALVAATLRGTSAFTRRHGGTVRRPSIAIGASRTGGSPLLLGEHSALLRLTDLAGADESQIRDRLRRAQPDVAASFSPSPVVGLAVRVANRLLRPRLGSTVLVSHLGKVEIDHVTSAVLLPVSSGASGVAVGAVTLVHPDGSEVTSVGIRTRSGQHGPDATQELLDDVVSALQGARDSSS